VSEATESPDGQATGHRPVLQWAGLCLYAGCTLARSAAGFGGGGAFSGLASLPDAPNAPGLVTGVAGSAGAGISIASSGPGGALLCPPRGSARGREYQPDLEDELLWLRLRRKVPDLDDWRHWPREPAVPDPPAGEEPSDEETGGAPPSIHGFGDGSEAGDGSDPGGLEPPRGDESTPASSTTGGDGEPRDGDGGPSSSTPGVADLDAGDAPEGSGGSGASIHGFGDAPPETEDPGDGAGRPDLDLRDTPRPPRSAIALIRTRPCAFLATVGLVVSLIALGFEFAYLRRLANPTGTDILRNAGYGAWTIAWLMMVAFTVRTLRLRDVARFWLLGFFAAAGIVALVGAGITAVTDPGILRTAILIPALEEMVKLALLGAFLLFAVRRRTREPSITDLAIVGFALGAAFAVHEDGLWVRVMADGFGSGFWGTLFPVFRHDPVTPIGPVTIMGHAGWGALIGLGLGLAWHLRRFRLAWLFAVVATAVAFFDHMSINYVLVQAQEGITRGAGWTMRELSGHGTRIAVLLVAGLAVGLLVDWLALRRSVAAHPLPPWSTGAGIRARLRALPGGGAKVFGAILLLGERRARLGVRYGVSRAASSVEIGPPDRRPA
jgi:RsiW-degrading membrane proteinase PrsW (M82 family)